MVSLREFATEGMHKRGPKKCRISGSLGVYDMYKYIRKNKWFNIGRPVKENEFYAIVRGINKLLVESLLTGEQIMLPHKMGALEIVRKESGVSLLESGRVKNTYPVNWSETWKLWYEDSEAREMKIRVRYEEPIIYRIKYNRYKAEYNNKSFYMFSINQPVRRALKEYIKQGKTDTIW